jgi:glucan-binding YG repeat protein
MDITIFQDITTEDALKQIEDNAPSEGLYVDMDNKDERKYVKDSAALISGMLKKLDRARIDKAKDYKARVESEAKSIRERLQAANEPFTALIDAHTLKRKQILDAKKAKDAAIELAKQVESDHEIGLLLNDKFDSEAEQREADRIAKQEAHDKEVAAQAIKAEQERQKREAEQREAEEAIRESNIEHKRQVNNQALWDFVSATGMAEDQARAVVSAIVSGAISNVSITY